jgi:hypothetical protein
MTIETLKSLIPSTTNIVFVLVAVSACVGFFLGKLDTAQFMLLASMVFGYFFGKPIDPSQAYGGK